MPTSSKADLGQLLMHSGPFAGMWFYPAELPPRALESGRFRVREGRWDGAYIRDEGSAGGRDWDWTS